MTNSSSTIVQRLWNYCNVLRDDGMSYGDYVEQLTYLLFLKMDEENAAPGQAQQPSRPSCGWSSLLGAGRRRAGSAVPPHPGRAGQGQRPDRHHLPQGAEQDPGPGQAAPAGRADRRRDVDRPGHRRQGRHLRGAAGEERPGRQVRRRAVLHPAPADQGHRGRDAARARVRPSATRPAAPAASCWRRYDYIVKQPQPARPRPEASISTARSAARLGDRGQHRPAVRDEPVPARHRRWTRLDSPIHVADAWPATPASASTWC